MTAAQWFPDILSSFYALSTDHPQPVDTRLPLPCVLDTIGFMTDLLPIPPLETAEDPALTATDVRQRWRALMGELGFGERLIWIAFIGPDRRFVKTLHQVAITPDPDPPLVRSLMQMLAGVLEGLDTGYTVALLLTGPGVGGICRPERQWARLLTEHAALNDVPLEPIFRANDQQLLQLPAA